MKKKVLLGLTIVLATVGLQRLPAMAQSTEECLPITLNVGASACGTEPTNMSSDPLSADDHRLLESERTRSIDPPIEHDPLGQALLDGAVGIPMGVGSTLLHGGSMIGNILKESAIGAGTSLGLGALEGGGESSESPEPSGFGAEGSGGANVEGFGGAEGSSGWGY
jgi:hypothetical protein